ncbi:MAG: hypothetical protein ACQES0_02165 [Bacteroidota bacterium]
MKKVKFIIILLCFVMFGKASQAQFGYKHVYDTIDGVAISYKWAHSKWLKKSSPLQLRFKMKNTNDYDVKIEFELAYMLNHIVKFESGELESEIKDGRAITGKLNGFYFETDKLSNEELKSDEFSWDFVKYEVTPLKEEEETEEK